MGNHQTRSPSNSARLIPTACRIRPQQHHPLGVAGHPGRPGPRLRSKRAYGRTPIRPCKGRETAACKSVLHAIGSVASDELLMLFEKTALARAEAGGLADGAVAAISRLDVAGSIVPSPEAASLSDESVALAGPSTVCRRGLEPPPYYPGPGPQPGNWGVRSVLCVHTVKIVRKSGRKGRSGRCGCCRGSCHEPRNRRLCEASTSLAQLVTPQPQEAEEQREAHPDGGAHSESGPVTGCHGVVGERGHRLALVEPFGGFTRVRTLPRQDN